MLVLDNPRVRLVMARVVHDRVSLKIPDVQLLRLEADRAVLKPSEPIAVEFIDSARKDDSVRGRLPFTAVRKKVRLHPRLNSVQKPRDNPVVAADRNPLVRVVEVVVVEREPHRKPPDDERRKLRAFSSPLLLGVLLYERLVDVAPDKRDCLLLKVPRLCCSAFFFLLLDFCQCLCRGCYAPYLVERVHVERQVEKPSVEVCDGRVCVAVEFGELVHKVPDFFVRRVEDVRAVLMHADSVEVLAEDVPAEVRTPVDYKAFFSALLCKICERRAVQS